MQSTWPAPRCFSPPSIAAMRAMQKSSKPCSTMPPSAGEPRPARSSWRRGMFSHPKSMSGSAIDSARSSARILVPFGQCLERGRKVLDEGGDVASLLADCRAREHLAQAGVCSQSLLDMLYELSGYTVVGQVELADLDGLHGPPRHLHQLPFHRQRWYSRPRYQPIDVGRRVQQEPGYCRAGPRTEKAGRDVCSGRSGRRAVGGTYPPE